MPPLRLYLFGSPQVERDGEPFPVPRRKTLALLAYLAVTGQRSSRESLATLFWPDYDQSGALANLRRDLSRLREFIDPEILVADRLQAYLEPGEATWVDIQAFQRLVKRAQKHAHPGDILCPDCQAGLEEALALYRADFLEGFTLPDSPAFDEWQFFQTQQLRGMLSSALQQLIQDRIHAGEYDQAIDHARRWLFLDNLHEPAHRTLMQLYAWTGQHAAALRQFQECQRLLAEELGVEPETETQALFSAIKTRQLQPPTGEPVQPASRPAESSKGKVRLHLPTYPTPFIGREQDLEALGQLLENPATRLLTILGPGGIGKTRLSVEAARAVAHLFPDGVYFIPLAPLHSPADIPFTIAEILGNQFFESGDPKTQLLEYLRGHQLLLVLDNFEHLLEGAGLLAEILSATTGVNLLVSSRERLNISSEQVYNLGNLLYPQDFDSAGILEYDAVRLFLQSTRLVRPDYELQSGDIQAIVRICQLVQGMPLALVLAAGWFEALSLEDIAAEITQSLDILETELQDIPDRQRSVRAVFDYSWNRLTPDQQLAYIQLSVFRGGFTRQAAQAVAGADLKTIRVLLNKSWLHLDVNERYHVHELLRQFGQEKLAADPALLQQVRERHSDYYADFLESIDREMRGHRLKEAFQSVTVEFENIRTAWHFLIERKEYQLAVDKILPGLFRYCESRSRAFELFRLLDDLNVAMGSHLVPGPGNILVLILITAREWFYPDGMPVRFESFGNIWEKSHNVALKQAWEVVEKPRDLLAMGFWGINLTYLNGRIFNRNEGIRHLKSLLPELRAGGKRWEVAYCLQHLVQLFEIDFDPEEDPTEIEGVALEALEIFEQLGDHRESGYTLKIFGQLRRFQHRTPEATQLFKSAQEKLLSIGDWSVAANIHGHLGDIYIQLGEFDEAFFNLNAMARAYLEKGNKRMAASAFSKESYEALRHGDIEHAKRTREMSISLAGETGDDMFYPWYLWEMGEVYRVSGDEANARKYFEEARRLFVSEDNKFGSVFYHRSMGDMAHTAGDFIEAARHFWESLTHAQQVPHPWAESYSRTGYARATARFGDLDSACSNILEALHLAKKVDEKGIAMVALEGAAEVFAAMEDRSHALELAGYLIDHPIAWKESKERARDLVRSLRSPSTLEIEEVLLEGWHGQDLWEVIQIVINLLTTASQSGLLPTEPGTSHRSNGNSHPKDRSKG